MTTTEPWLERWEIDRSLSGGGQGTTYVVQCKGSKGLGVLKVLRKQESSEARRRMFREVNNLKALSDAGCRVPQILDGNTDKFEDMTVPLYFVMEFVPGPTLAAYVAASKGLPLKDAASLVFKLCEIVRVAQKETILHRDIKPENIVLHPLGEGGSEFQAHDVVVVDYGLSFNRNEDEALTGGSETLDNKFLSLPERRIPGGDRRDARSDLTGICGILYFCIMGEPPVDLVGPDGKPPHRRAGHSIREKLGDGAATRQLEVLLDRGLAANIDNRFQSVEELISRLREVVEPTARVPWESPAVVAKRAAELLLARDRRTQLGIYSQNAHKVLLALQQKAEGLWPPLRPFSLSLLNTGEMKDIGLPGYDLLSYPFGCRAHTIHVENNPDTVMIWYQVVAQGTQCAVFRCLFKYEVPSQEKYNKVGDWECVLRFDGMGNPDLGPILQDYEAVAVEVMEILQRDILERQ